MTTKKEEQPGRAATPEIDWIEVAKAALGSAVVAGVVGGALHVLGKMLDAETAESPRDAQPEVDEPASVPVAEEPPCVEHDEGDEDVFAAAALLGVAPDATEDEVRSALRTWLGTSQGHPDQGGDDEVAKRFIAAKNLLVERIRAKRL